MVLLPQLGQQRNLLVTQHFSQIRIMYQLFMLNCGILCHRGCLQWPQYCFSSICLPIITEMVEDQT